MSTREPAPAPEGGGLSAGVLLAVVAAYFVGRWAQPDAPIVATMLAGAAWLIIPAVLLAAVLLSAASHRPARRTRSRGRRH